MQSESPESPPVITVTDRARRRLAAMLADEPEPSSIALLVEVTGVADGEFTVSMALQPRAFARPGDAVQEWEDPSLGAIVSAESVEALRGAVVDLSRDLLNPGFVIENPNSPSPAVGASVPEGLELTGDVPERVQAVLDRQINPSIAAHGGRADLVGVEGDTAYLRLSGGCQGCGMASVTLGQGIRVTLLETVPEIKQVVDVTDHASGTNPYFEPSKK